MKKEYIVYKLSECAKQACRIDNELFTKYNVKRGLRNEDGTGVLVGLTKIGNVVGYERTEEGLKPIPGKLVYRGYDLDDIAHALLKEKRFGFEEVAYLLLSGELPDSEQLAAFKELINDNMPLDKKTTIDTWTDMAAKLDKARENLARALDAKTKADEEAKRQAEEQEQQQQPQQAAPIPTPAPTPTPQYHGSSGGSGSKTVPRGNNGGNTNNGGTSNSGGSSGGNSGGWYVPPETPDNSLPNNDSSL